MKDYFIFYSCFVSKRLSEAAVYVNANMVGMVKINTKGLCKDMIDKLTNDCTAGSYLMLKRKSAVLRDRLLINIGCKYNVRKVISLIYKV